MSAHVLFLLVVVVVLLVVVVVFEVAYFTAETSSRFATYIIVVDAVHVDCPVVTASVGF